MHYMIDFDKWLIHARHEDGKVLNKYGEDEGLDMGMEIVSNPEELCLILDIDEIVKIHGNLTGRQETFLDEEEAADALWIAMEERANDIPELDNGKLIAVNVENDMPEDDEWDEPEEDVKEIKDPPKPKKKKGVRAKDLIGMSFQLGDKVPRDGTTFAILTDYIADDMVDVHFDDLVTEFIDKYKPAKSNATVDEKFASGYIRGAVNAGYIEESL